MVIGVETVSGALEASTSALRTVGDAMAETRTAELKARRLFSVKWLLLNEDEKSECLGALVRVETKGRFCEGSDAPVLCPDGVAARGSEYKAER